MIIEYSHLWSTFFIPNLSLKPTMFSLNRDVSSRRRSATHGAPKLFLLLSCTILFPMYPNGREQMIRVMHSIKFNNNPLQLHFTLSLHDYTLPTRGTTPRGNLAGTLGWICLMRKWRELDLSTNNVQKWREESASHR